ncbi:pantothenate kinase 1 [Tanacetum coccineum]
MIYFHISLVNIGSGVSMIKVDGDGKFERVSGTSIGGGTFWGLGKLLTKCKSFDALLEMSHEGNNRVIDMLVGDIYGELDYSKLLGCAYLMPFACLLACLFDVGFLFALALFHHLPLSNTLMHTYISWRSFGSSLFTSEFILEVGVGSVYISPPRYLLRRDWIAYLNALRFGLKKIFFGGFFIGGHAYTMDTISVAVDFW